LIDQQVAVPARALDEVRGGHARVRERDLGVGREPVADLADQLVADAGRSAFDHDRGQPLGAAFVGIGADHDDADVRPLAVPAGDVARPVLAAVEDVVVTVELGRHADADGVRKRRVEVRGAARRPGRLAHRVADEVLAGRVGCRGAQEPVLLFLAAPVPDRHEPEPVDEHGAREARVDRAELLGGDDHVDVGEPAAPVLRREHAERDAAFVGVDVGRFRHLERAQRVGLGVGLAHDRRKDVLREVPHLELHFFCSSVRVKSMAMWPPFGKWTRTTNGDAPGERVAIGAPSAASAPRARASSNWSDGATTQPWGPSRTSRR
jgi:hypothetical protein